MASTRDRINSRGDLVIQQSGDTHDVLSSDIDPVELLTILSSSNTVTEDPLTSLKSGVPYRRRGRPRRTDDRSHRSRIPRLNPDRAARHKRMRSLDSVDGDGSTPSTSAISATTSKESSVIERSQKRGVHRTSCSGPCKPKGRPRREVPKPICVVKPMIQGCSESKPRRCSWSDCNHVATSVRNLKLHVERDHTNQLSHYYCRWEGCSRANPFKAPYMLNLHLRSHIGKQVSKHCLRRSGDKPYECQICSSTFTRQENLKTHIRSHNDDRAYKCGICQKGFFSSSDKSKHQNRTHNPNKMFRCPVIYCSKAYTDPSSLRKHMLKFHGDGLFEKAKENKRQNGPNGGYGVISLPSSSLLDLSNQPSTSRI